MEAGEAGTYEPPTESARRKVRSTRMIRSTRANLRVESAKESLLRS